MHQALCVEQVFHALLVRERHRKHEAIVGVADLRARGEPLRTLIVKTLAVPVRGKDGQIVETVLRKDRSTMSMIRNHVVPRLGHLPLAALDSDRVGEAATTFQVRKTESPGKKAKRAASADHPCEDLTESAP